VTGRVELDADTTVNITMETTVPIGFPTCNDLSFSYDHAVPGVAKSSCATFFREERLQHAIHLRAERTEGCKSYISLMAFRPYSRPPALMWENYVQSNITVRL